MSIDDQFIAAWRDSAIHPETPDEAELSIRRRLAENEAVLGTLKDGIESLACVMGQSLTLTEDLLRRQSRKELCSLEARIRKLEAKAYPAGGGKKTSP